MVEMVSTHSRLKAAGRRRAGGKGRGVVSTHSRLKAAGTTPKKWGSHKYVSTHSRLKAAGFALVIKLMDIWFQHTAA